MFKYIRVPDYYMEQKSSSIGLKDKFWWIVIVSAIIILYIIFKMTSKIDLKTFLLFLGVLVIIGIIRFWRWFVPESTWIKIGKKLDSFNKK